MQLTPGSDALSSSAPRSPPPNPAVSTDCSWWSMTPTPARTALMEYGDGPGEVFQVAKR
jgi:hypothetical protein